VEECERDRNNDLSSHHQAQVLGYAKTEMASRNDTEINVIDIWGLETFLRGRITAALWRKEVV
jgi:hypothetical protein